MPDVLHAGPAPAEDETPAPAPPPKPEPAPTVAADGAVVITDAKGRQLKLRDELDILQQMDLLELAGKDRVDNQPWMNMVLISARVAAIDDTPVIFPKNDVTLRAMLKRVDFFGVVAVGAYLYPEAMRGDTEAPPPDDEARAKN